MIVVYMTNCSRLRRGEALNCLWKMGVKNYPEFINLADKRVDSINEGVQLWGGKEAILEQVVARIRRYKPEVIVTHDLNGEYGHNQHKITARCMSYAIEVAADDGEPGVPGLVGLPDEVEGGVGGLERVDGRAGRHDVLRRGVAEFE